MLPIVINKTPINEVYYGENSGEKYEKITQIGHRIKPQQNITDNYIKTNSTPDTPVILTISHKQKNGYYEYDSKVKTNKATNDKIFGKKRR